MTDEWEVQQEHMREVINEVMAEQKSNDREPYAEWLEQNRESLVRDFAKDFECVFNEYCYQIWEGIYGSQR